MSKKLVIVESPAKAKTLSKILGRGYDLKASLGHVRDLPRGKMGVEIENGFIPNYVIPKAKTKLVNEIRQAAKAAGSGRRMSCGARHSRPAARGSAAPPHRPDHVHSGHSSCAGEMAAPL